VKSSKKAVIIGLILGASVFGYSQYASASQIGVEITQSELVEENNKGTIYNVELEFDNPSLLMLNAGETEFTVSTSKSRIGDGTLEPFILSPLSKTTVSGTFISEDTNLKSSDGESPTVKISGVTTYDVLFTSIDVPFVFYPSEEQAREFIQQD